MSGLLQEDSSTSDEDTPVGFWSPGSSDFDDTMPFRFLDLPAELQNCIYEFALTSPDGIKAVFGNDGISPRSLKMRLVCSEPHNLEPSTKPEEDQLCLEDEGISFQIYRVY